MNIEIDPVPYVLLLVTLMTIFLLLILIFVIRQQIYMKRLYEKIESGIITGNAPLSPDSFMEEAAPAGVEESTDGEAARFKEEEELRMKKEEERKLLEEERAKDPGEYYKSDSIRDNLLALFERYKLNSFTMSTSDGLVISSTDPNPEEEAAKYSYLYQQGKQPEISNVRLIGVPHKGGTVVGIVKADDELSEKELEFIERDINFILRKNV